MCVEKNSFILRRISEGIEAIRFQYFKVIKSVEDKGFIERYMGQKIAENVFFLNRKWKSKSQFFKMR